MRRAHRQGPPAGFPRDHACRVSSGRNGDSRQHRPGRRSVRLLSLAYAIGAGLIADYAAKTAALTFLDPLYRSPRGFVTLQLVRNPGAAFSMGENFTIVLSRIAVAAFAFVGGYPSSGEARRLGRR